MATTSRPTLLRRPHKVSLVRTPTQIFFAQMMTRFAQKSRFPLRLFTKPPPHVMIARRFRPAQCIRLARSAFGRTSCFLVIR